MAPEMINEDENEIGKAADIWGVGVTLFYLIEGKQSFPGRTIKEIEKSINFNKPCKFTNLVSPKLQAFILSILQKKQFLRPTIEQLLNHLLFMSTRELLIEMEFV
jgi:serine/threonine protein kinase